MNTTTDRLKNQITQTPRKRSSDESPSIQQRKAARIGCARTMTPAVKQTKNSSCSGQPYCLTSHVATAITLRIPAPIQMQIRLGEKDSNANMGRMKVAPRQATK